MHSVKYYYIFVVDKERAIHQPDEWWKIEKNMKYYVIVDGKFNYFESTAAADGFLIDCFLDGCKKIDWTIYEKIEKGDEITAVANDIIYKLKTDVGGELLYININNQGYKKIKVVERSGWYIKIQKTQIITNDILYLISGLYKDIKDNFNLGIKIVHNIYEAAKVV